MYSGHSGQVYSGHSDIVATLPGTKYTLFIIFRLDPKCTVIVNNNADIYNVCTVVPPMYIYIYIYIYIFNYIYIIIYEYVYNRVRFI